MTATAIARDAAFYIRTQPIKRAVRPAADSVIERMNEIELNGNFDKDQDGLRRSRFGNVGGVKTMVQVATLGMDTLLIFWNLEDGHQRRILVDSRDRLVMDTGRGTSIIISENNKYYGPCWAILKARAN